MRHALRPIVGHRLHLDVWDEVTNCNRQWSGLSRVAVRHHHKNADSRSGPPAPDTGEAARPAAAATLHGVGAIRQVVTADDFAALGALVREYVASLPFVLDFQDIDRELAELERDYSPPVGTAVLAELDGTPVGCAGIRAFEPPAVAELEAHVPAAIGARCRPRT